MNPVYVETTFNKLHLADSSFTESNLAVSKAYVDGQISDLIGGAPALLNTLKEIADSINNDGNVVVTLTNLVAAERAERTGIDQNITAMLSDEIATRAAGDKALRNEYSQADAKIRSNIQDEADRAVAAEVVLQSVIVQNKSDGELSVSNEASFRIGEDTRIESKFDGITTSLDASVIANQSNILTEAARAQGVEASIESRKLEKLSTGIDYAYENDAVSSVEVGSVLHCQNYLKLGNRWRLSFNSDSDEKRLVFEYKSIASDEGSWVTSIPFIQA